MKKQFLLASLLAILYSATFAQTDYLQFEVIYLKPKLDKLDLLRKGLAAHNKKYHATAPYKASVSSIITGPNSGDYVWVMGPTTWAQLDGAPSMGAGEHMMDWEKNINPYCESVGELSYWRVVNEASYQPEGSPTFKKSRMRASYIYPGQMGRFTEQMKKIVEVLKAKKSKTSFTMVMREGLSAGINVVTFNDFDKWSWLDEAATFGKDYEEVHGPNSWTRFLEEIDLSLDRSRTYDELSESVPELGG